MLEETVQINKADNSQIWIKTQPKGGCSNCSNSGCTSQVLSGIFSTKETMVQLDNHLNAKAGDNVVIGISNKLLLSAALRVYLLPVLFMIITAVIANKTGLSDPAQCIVSLGGLAAGFLFVKKFSCGNASLQRFKPKLLRLAN